MIGMSHHERWYDLTVGDSTGCWVNWWAVSLLMNSFSCDIFWRHHYCLHVVECILVWSRFCFLYFRLISIRKISWFRCPMIFRFANDNRNHSNVCVLSMKVTLAVTSFYVLFFAATETFLYSLLILLPSQLSSEVEWQLPPLRGVLFSNPWPPQQPVPCIFSAFRCLLRESQSSHNLQKAVQRLHSRFGYCRQRLHSLRLCTSHSNIRLYSSSLSSKSAWVLHKVMQVSHWSRPHPANYCYSSHKCWSNQTLQLAVRVRWLLTIVTISRSIMRMYRVFI